MALEAGNHVQVFVLASPSEKGRNHTRLFNVPLSQYRQKLVHVSDQHFEQ
jgi:hypothetical protein